MALQVAPGSIDITDIQFKAHSKYQLFNINASTPNFNGIDLLATASTFGLIIVGRPSAQEIQVLQLKDVVANKESPTIPVRSINIPGETYILALSCDHSMLSVCYTANGLSFIDIFEVQSFLSNNVRCLMSKIMVSNTDNVKVKQILWNPVIQNTMALCLSDGALGAYVFKANSFEYNSLDKAENARCACWSPKGKQIVVAFQNGKLAQFKPDLKLAKTIPCTTQLFPGPFSPIAVQWLSTYQFAVVFVEEKEDALQSLFIVNAPKTTPPTYINYEDITYSQNGPRAPQVFLIHILQWNLMLMASANGTEIGILGTTESGETPLWKQYMFIDEGRAELPLTADDQDTFPIGLALETGCTHQLVIGENQIPVMPMLHILSTHGFLLSFNLLNLQPTRVDICSPPQNLLDQSGLGLFRQNVVDAKPAISAQIVTPPNQLTSVVKTSSATSNDFNVNNLTFAIPETGATSTPAKPPQSQIKPAFGLISTETQQPKPAMNSLFGSTSSVGFGGLEGSKEVPKPFSQPFAPAQASTPAPATSVLQKNAVNITKVSTDTNKPFLTVQPNYKSATQTNKSSSTGIVSNSENDAILRKLIREEIDAFDAEIRAALNRSKNIQINICSKDELSKLIRSIDEMQEITMQATESTESIKADVNSLRLTLYEMHAMMAEAQSKVDEFNRLGKTSDGNSAANQTYKRLINKLQNQLAQNQARFDVFSKQLDSNWSAHLQNQRENDKARMRIPTLENVYQTLEQQHQILMKEKAKINKIKAKMGVRDSSPHKIKYSYSNTENIKMNSLVDSVLSLTIGDQIKNERRALNATKLDALRKSTVSSQKVNFIKPSRPDRKGLNSEIIIEKKLAHAKAQKEKENLKKAELEAERAKQEELANWQLAKQKQLAKPPLLAAPTTQQANVSLISKPLVEKQTPQVLQPTTTTPASSSSLFENLTKQSFGSPQITSVSTSKPIETKPIFGGEKTSSPFGITTENSAANPESIPNLNTSLSKVVSFDIASSAISGLSFGTKTKDSSSMVSTGFSFASTTMTPTFGLSTLTKSDALNLAKPPTSIQQTNQTTIKNEPKPALLPTPSTSIRETLQTTPVATSGFNITPKSTTVKSAPLLATPNIPPQHPSVANPPNTASSAFKFDLGNAFSSPSPDKPKVDKENIPIAVSATPITITSSIGSFSFLSAGAATSSTPSSKLSTPVVPTVKTSPIAASIPTPVPAQSSAPSSIGFSFAKASSETSFAASTTTTTTNTPNAAVSSSADVGSLFQGFNVCKPNVVNNENTGKSLFSTNSFGTQSSNAISPTSTSSIFGASAAQVPSTAVQTSLFGGKSITDSTSTPQATTTTTSLFGVKSPDTSAPQPATGGNIFGAKAVESASLSFGGFGISSTPTSSAVSPSASTGNIFGGAAAATKPASNIFGGANNNTNSGTNTASIFGGGGVTTPASPSNAFGSSPFGNANSTANVFGGGNVATSTATSPTSGSIFGGASPNPSSGGSIFGGSASFSSSQQATTGFGSSTFGGSGGAFGTSNAATAQASAFGGSFSQATSNAPAFGTQPAFGSPFGQTNPQQQQAGFGSPQSQQSGFGLSAIAAQSNPTFGSSATFGAAPTFGSPKSGFGTFSNVNPNPSFSTPPKNSLFESLGSSENAMTFGNLAHQSPNAAATPKPFSGGSSFSSWR